MKELVLYGAGGMGREALQIVHAMNDVCERDEGRIDVLGFLDDDAALHGTDVYGFPVLGDRRWLQDHSSVYVAVAVGFPRFKKLMVDALARVKHERIATLSHPSAWIGQGVEIGAGTIVSGGAHITIDVKIGRFCTVNLQCNIGHQAVLDDFVTLGPAVNTSGLVHVHEAADIGTGTTIIPGRSIGRGAVIGAGAVVLKDVPDNVTAVGMPARVVHQH